MVKVALLIGVSKYEPGLTPLPAAVKDTETLQRVLRDPQMGGFDEVKALANPDRQTMESEIETLFSGRTKDDLVLLFFSGHGIKDDGGKLYFATHITRKNLKGELIRSTAVAANFVHEVMNNSRTKRQVIILDCCFSGAFDPALQAKDDGSVDLQTQLGGEGRVVLTSSSSTQYSFEQQGSDLSIYTRYLVEGIETGAGDRNEDGKISTWELHNYAVERVQETAPNMTPKMITLKDMGFEIILAKAKIADPKLRYRRQAERYASQGEISKVGRTILDTLRNQLGLVLEVTTAIEDEILRPYRERIENLQRYRQAFIAAIEQEYPLSKKTELELKDLYEIFGLRSEDISLIEAEEVAKKTAEQEVYAIKLKRYEQEFQTAMQAEYPFSEYVKNGLINFQQSLELNDEDVAQIERLFIDRKKAELQLRYEEKLKREEAEKQQQKQQKQLEYQQSLEKYKQKFFNSAQTKYPLSDIVREELNHFQRDLGLADKDIALIEQHLIKQAKRSYVVEEGFNTFTNQGVEQSKVCTPDLLYLRVLGTSYAYELPNTLETISIGRQRRKSNSPDDGNDVVIRVTHSEQKSLKISRKHLEIKRIGSEYFVIDKSGGRTKLNGQSIQDTEVHKLKAQDRLQIADVLELEVLIQVKVTTLSANKSIEFHQSGQLQPQFIVEASVGDMVTVDELSVGNMVTERFDK
jgi:uncharacterized caspase-like protein